ncbi:MAG TPA: isoprenylcysteine carboxylmethyltransferase family protein, partial [Ktedonobacteraceae bacterium]
DGANNLMKPLIYTEVFYLLVFLFVFLAWSLSELLGPARWKGSDESEKRDRWSMYVLASTSTLGFGCFWLFPLIFPWTTVPATLQHLAFFLGVGLAAAGLWLRWSAIRTLGRYFTGQVMIHADQVVVQRGPYSFVRHPSYSGILLVAIGLGLMMTNWASLVAFPTGMFLGLLYRMNVEEQELLHHHSEVYKDYMRRTKRLIPYIF